MALKPKFTITEKILNNLTQIAVAREVVEQAPLEPRWEALLRRQAKDLQVLFKISAQAVHKELARLVDRKVIRPVGAGRAAYYVFK